MSYAGAGVTAPANGTDNSYTFFKPTFDHIFAQYTAYATATDATLATNTTNIATNTAAIGTPGASSIALTIFKRDANAAGSLGSLAIGGASAISNGVAQLSAQAVGGQSLDIASLKQSDGTNAFRVDPFGNTVIGAGTAYRSLTIQGAISAATTITATDHFIGPLTGDVTGNATGLKNLTAGGIPVGIGTGVATILAAGTNGYILTSNGPGNSPTWQANAGGGGSGTATYANVKNTTTDASLSDILTRWVSGPVIDSVIPGTTGGLGIYVPDPNNPIVVSINGTTRKSTVAVYSTIGNLSPGVSPAGIYSLAADVSTAGTSLFTLAILAPGASPTANQMIIGTALWDGSSFQLGTNGGFLYTCQSTVNGYNVRTVRNKIPLFDPNGASALPIAGSPVVLPGATNGAAQIVMTHDPPLSGLTAEIDFAVDVWQPASPATFILYVYYSQGAGVAPTTQLLPGIDGFGLPASTHLTLSRKILLEGLDSRPLNLGFFYVAGAATVILRNATLNVKFSR